MECGTAYQQPYTGPAKCTSPAYMLVLTIGISGAADRSRA